MRRITGLLKPEYLYNPGLLLHRVMARQNSRVGGGFCTQPLPWKLAIRARSDEIHGEMLSTLGVIDLPVTEALWRLIDPKDLCVDVGANIGYMTSVMAARAKLGTICAFEANPQVFTELEFNVARWRVDLPDTEFTILAKAVSNAPGEVMLSMPSNFSINRGLSCVVPDAPIEDTGTRGNTVCVKATTLDDTFPSPLRIAVMKVDVEGHEGMVFEGAVELLSNRRIRDIVFEEHQPYPTAASGRLTEAGYTIFQIARTFLGPSLVPAGGSSPRSDWEPTSFLASCEPHRAVRRLRSRGWFSLQRSAKPSDCN
jgi:FkbM family methyltransferase